MIKALIPVRKNSQRVKDKNVRLFAGSSLLEIKINQLKRISGIEEVCVNSDCEEMLNIAERLGATAILRDPYYASNDVPMNEVWKNMAENMVCETILYTNVTNPLVRDTSYSEIIKLWELGLPGEYDSITTVHAIQEYLWFAGRSVNYDAAAHPRSQDLPIYYGLNFAVSVIPKSLLVTRKSIIGHNFFPYTLDKIEAIDIDDEVDMTVAESLYLQTIL